SKKSKTKQVGRCACRRTLWRPLHPVWKNWHRGENTILKVFGPHRPAFQFSGQLKAVKTSTSILADLLGFEFYGVNHHRLDRHVLMHTAIASFHLFDIMYDIHPFDNLPKDRITIAIRRSVLVI